MKKRILIFPCGSEVALEIYRSLRFSRHFHLIGASSVDDHGKFVFEDYVGGVPFCHEMDFIDEIKKLVKVKKIDAIYPAMDSVAKTLKENEEELGCVVIGSSSQATSVCASKAKIYKRLEGIVPCPEWTTSIEFVKTFPVFLKPDEGYGSRDVYLAENFISAKRFIEDSKNKYFLFCEYLPGNEFTIDCFSDFRGRLLFHGIRERVRISNGISVNTVSSNAHSEIFKSVAEKINTELIPRGAWFFQMKEDEKGRPKLLEVAARLGGSSGYFRVKGVNFALLTAFDSFVVPVSIHENDYHLELDRFLGNRFKLNLIYDLIYVDLDDCLIIDNEVNNHLMSFLFQSLNKGKRLVLLTRHSGNLSETLTKYRLDNIFDEVVHIPDNTKKSRYVGCFNNAIFIDDSFIERKDVFEKCGIPVFSPDMIDALIE